MPAQFRKVYKIQGYDRHCTPHWQMVPKGDSRYVVLRDGAGLTVTSSNAAIVRVTEITARDLPAGDLQEAVTGRVFKLDGLARGAATIEAKRGATLETSLGINVKDKKTVRVSFNFVKDNAGHATKRAPAAATQWVREMNAIYLPQTNIEVVLRFARWVTVAQNLGQVVRFSSHLPGVPASQHEWDIVTATGDSTADMNYFLVWEYEQDNSPFTDQTDAGCLSNNCIFEDNAGKQVGETMAHEMGHYLGCDDHYDTARKRDLMYGITDARGIHIGRDHANTMNP